VYAFLFHHLFHHRLRGQKTAEGGAPPVGFEEFDVGFQKLGGQIRRGHVVHGKAQRLAGCGDLFEDGVDILGLRAVSHHGGRLTAGRLDCFNNFIQLGLLMSSVQFLPIQRMNVELLKQKLS
jgi:hypothetical protein